ncbi:MAG TPA: hypothetical protein EYP25_10445 [Anaerolineae bacterium]|nr:hypothetical protein [Caldilineae bacterium]HID34960.1 hypothetical protein [Anaerolineae bacterium]
MSPLSSPRIPPRTKRTLLPIPPGLWFWAGFLTFNFLLFLPLYLLNAQDAAFLPSVPLQRLLTRDNPDIFRFNLEISLLLLLFLLARPLWRASRRKWVSRAFFLLHLLTLLYAIYESVILSLYHTSPILYNDIRFFISGVGFLIDGLRLSAWQLLLIALTLVIAFLLLYKLIILWFMRVPVERMGRASRLAAIALILLFLALTLTQGRAAAQPASELNSLSAKLLANTRASLLAREDVQAYDRIHPEAIYDYARTTRLFRKPNIYLIFIESYGSVLYKRSHFTNDYLALMAEMEARLRDGGWTMETGLSRSPTWGGGSWMAYTSAEFGLYISSQPQFLAIKDRFIRQPYPSLGRYLQTQGYHHVRLAPIQRALSAAEDEANDALYGPDRWLRFADLDYQGPLYGWGPSPPDQFTLNKARELLRSQSPFPLFLVYLTQNSHYPWAPLPPLTANWRDLNDPNWPSPPPIGEPIPHRDNIKHYREAIRYQWETLSQLILDTPASEDAIFILIGDHQPPRVSRRADSFDTPIHILARDHDFPPRFETYGFEPGLVVSDLRQDMQHEGFYAMFIRELAGAYGASAAPLPYLPQGIQLHLPTPTP